MDGWVDGWMDGWMDGWGEREIQKERSLSGDILGLFRSVLGHPLHACCMCLQRAKVGPLG